MQTVSKFFKQERDYLYRRGEAKGEAKGEVKGEIKGKREVIENLITAFGFSNEQAASAAEVTVDFVEKVRASLSKKKNK
jgi:predicted transposase YdaD